MLSISFAQEQFLKLLEETFERQGWAIPNTLSKYATQILVDRLDKNPWQPEPSYAEQYMTLTDPRALKSLGDTCWFTRAVFPTMGQHRGITSNYYVELGTGCYARAQRQISSPTLKAMEQHFEFIAEAAHTAIWSKGAFRSMWD